MSGRLASLVASLDAMRRERGTVVTLLFVIHRLLEAGSGGRARLVPYALMAQPMSPGRFGTLRDDRHTVIRQVSADEPLLRDCPRPPQVIAARFESGAQCFLASVKDEFAGFIWICRDRYVEDEVRCRYLLPGANAVWDFDVYVAPRFRFGRTMARLWIAVTMAMARSGVEWSFSRISMFNEASVAAHARLGAVAVGHVTFLVIGPVQLAMLPTFPYVSLGTRAAPDIALRAPAAPD